MEKDREADLGKVPDPRKDADAWDVLDSRKGSDSGKDTNAVDGPDQGKTSDLGKDTDEGDILDLRKVPDTQRERERLQWSNRKLERDINGLDQELSELADRNLRLAGERKEKIRQLQRRQKEFERIRLEAEDVSLRCRADREILNRYADASSGALELIRHAVEGVNRMEEEIRRIVKEQEKRAAELEGVLKPGRQ